jgi:DNA helicase-2/ATP-dependent DNA helicase PcrA
MTTVRFSKDEFELALPQDKNTGLPLWECQGLDKGELVYTINVKGTNKRIVIRSSVRSNGFAAESGEDSIRHWVEYRYKNHWVPLTKDKKSWTTRVPGWEGRLNDALRRLYKVALADSRKKVEYGPENPHPESIAASNTDAFSFLGEEVTDTGETELPAETPRISRELEEFVEGLSLNDYQKEVVRALGRGPQVVEACPGSGKTRTLENLVAALIISGVNPATIGVFTFTNSAAEEARHRIATTLWPEGSEEEIDFLVNYKANKGKFPEEWIDADPARRMLVNWVCTIHALSYRLLRERGEKLRVLEGRDEYEAINLVKDSLAEFNWDESHKSVFGYIGHAIRKLVDPGNAEAFYSKLLTGTDVAWRAGDLARIYDRYVTFCRRRNLIDFNMMQAKVVRLLRENPAARKEFQSKFDYILVDEAQDTSPEQAEILWVLAERTGNIVFCGDVDQSMYAFRGAEPEVLRGKFKAAWPKVRRFNLPINYRSSQNIVDAASKLIERNYSGAEEYLKPFQFRPDAPEGKKLTSDIFPDFLELSEEVASIVAENPGDWFVLSRTRAECSAIHTELIRRKIPAVNRSGGLLFGSPPIRKALAYARLACDYKGARDDLEILSEIANVASVNFQAPYTKRRHRDGCNNRVGWKDCGCPVIMEEGVDYSHARYYGKKAIQEAGGWKGIVQQTYKTNRGGYPTTQAKGAQDLVSFVNALELLEGDAHACLRKIVDACIIPWVAVEYGLQDADLAEDGIVEMIDLLFTLLEPGQTMEEYLNEVEAISSGDSTESEEGSVIIGTIHWSKGLERPNVVLNATRLPIIPPKNIPGKLPMGRPPTMEEERRLAYVAVTRAKSEVCVVSSRRWLDNDVPVSVFLSELGI